MALELLEKMLWVCRVFFLSYLQSYEFHVKVMFLFSYLLGNSRMDFFFNIFLFSFPSLNYIQKDFLFSVCVSSLLWYNSHTLALSLLCSTSIRAIAAEIRRCRRGEARFVAARGSGQLSQALREISSQLSYISPSPLQPSHSVSSVQTPTNISLLQSKCFFSLLPIDCSMILSILATGCGR